MHAQIQLTSSQTATVTVYHFPAAVTRHSEFFSLVLRQDENEGTIILSREQADLLCTRLCQALQDSDPTAPPLVERDPTPDVPQLPQAQAYVAIGRTSGRQFGPAVHAVDYKTALAAFDWQGCTEPVEVMLRSDMEAPVAQ